MFPLLALCAKRTQSATAFCAEHDVTPAQLSHWRRKCREVFMEITPSPQAPVEVRYPGGVCIRFPGPVSASYLAELVGL